jgi:hypothetical protein
MHRVPVGLLGVVLLCGGCYVNQPLGEAAPAPAPGTHLVLELTDAGRVAMGPQLGPEVASVEGALIERSDSQYVLGVSNVVNLWGVQSRWEGERIAVGAGSVRRMFSRRISPGRTAVAVAAGTAGFVAFVLTRDLLGFGTATDANKPPSPPNGN